MDFHIEVEQNQYGHFGQIYLGEHLLWTTAGKDSSAAAKDEATKHLTTTLERFLDGGVKAS